MIFLVGLLVMLPWIVGRIGVSVFWIPLGLLPVVVGVGVGVYFWLRVFVRTHNGQICSRCNYPLSSLPAPGACPECGKAFGANRDRDYWSRYL